MKSDRNGQGSEKKNVWRSTRIGYAKEKDERGDLVNIDRKKNGKRI